MKQRGAVAPATKPGWRPHRDHAGTAFRTSTRHGGYERMVGRKPRGCDAVAFPGRKAPGARFAGKTLTTASPRPHSGHTATAVEATARTNAETLATTVGLFRAYVRELEPAVTSGLCASKAPNTSSFSRGGTLKCSSVSASTAET